MAIETFFDRVKVAVSGTPGTGAITLGAAVAGFRTLATAGVADQAKVSYVIEDGTNWEIGRGTYSSGSNSLARTTILESSAGGTTAISASSAAVVYLTLLAADIADIASGIAAAGDGSSTGSGGTIYAGQGSGDPHYGWRIRATSTYADDGPVGTNEVTMSHVAGGGNFATGVSPQQPFASSTESGRTPAQAFDQNETSLWGSAPGSTFPQFIGMLYQNKQAVLQVTIEASSDGYWIHRAPAEFVVEWSDDTTTGIDGTWTQAWAVVGNDGAYSGNEIRTFVNPNPTYGSSYSTAVPAGGTAGQVLTKVDSTSNNVEWASPAASSGGTSGAVGQASASDWRISSLTSTDTYVSFAELKFLVGSTPQAVLSSSASDVTLGASSLGCDGNTSTEWATNKTSYPNPYFAEHFSGAIAPTELTIQARNDGYYDQTPNGGSIDYSPDGGTSWISVGTFSLPAWSSAGQIQTVPIPQVDPTAAQRSGNGWRINYLRSTDASFKAVAELTFRDASTAVLTPASTLESDDYEGLSVGNTVDGNTGTKWASNGTLPYIGQIFSGPVTPTSMEITSCSDSYYGQTVTEGEIEYSPDGGTTWHYVCSFKFANWSSSSQSQYFAIPKV